MKRILPRLLPAVMLLLTVQVYPQVTVPESVMPGNPVVVTMLGTDASQVRVFDPDGNEVARADAFAAGLGPWVQVRCMILGMDSTLQPGVYVLQVVDAADDQLYAGLLTVGQGEFRTEEIPLSQTLTELRQSEDPRKYAEYEELRDVYMQFNPDAVYHTGAFQWPFPLTRRTSWFGDRRTYLYADGERASIIHAGTDLASPTGTPVRASGSGVVRMAKLRIVTGNSVVIEHLPGVFSLYYHLDELGVAPGDRIGAGEMIGTVGATGLATGPHLHWEFRVGGVAVDPEAVLEGLVVDFGL